MLEDEKDPAPRTVHNAIHNVTLSMHAYDPKGSYPEGPGYWSYGTSYNVVLIDLLETVLGSDFALTQAPGFDQTGQYPALMCGPSGDFFNYADGGAGRGPESCLFWFAAGFDRPDWLLGERELLRAAVAEADARDAQGGGGRLLPLALLWMDRVEEAPPIRMPLHWFSESKTPVTVHRSSWTDPAATFVGLKGGSPSAPHGQMDIGSFVLDADKVRWAVDLGAEGYHGIESRGMNLWSSSQNSDRWKIFRQSNEGHNTLVIDGQLQKASASAPVVEFSDDPAFPHSIVDMSAVYAGQAGSVRRGLSPADGRDVLIQDQLTGLKPGSRVRWGMITPGTPGQAGTPRIELKQEKAAPGDDGPRTPVGRLEDNRHGQASQRVGLAQSGHHDDRLRGRCARVGRTHPGGPGRAGCRCQLNGEGGEDHPLGKLGEVTLASFGQPFQNNDSWF